MTGATSSPTDATELTPVSGYPHDFAAPMSPALTDRLAYVGRPPARRTCLATPVVLYRNRAISTVTL